MLIRAGKLIEKSGLTAVLIAHKSKCKKRIIRERITVSLHVEAAFLTKSGMLYGDGSFVLSAPFL